MSRMRYLLLSASAILLVVSLAVVGCGGSSSGPTAPPEPIAGVAGTSTGSSSSGIDSVAFASLVIEKATNGVDADFPPGPTIPVGASVTWTYSVTNNGNEALSNIDVTDNPEGPVTCPFSALDPGESMDCTPILETAVEGPYSNTATVSGDKADGNTITASDTSNYSGSVGDVQIALDLEKQTNGEDADSPMGPILSIGDPVTWSYVVTNNSDEMATEIMVMDDLEGLVTCPDTTLASGSQMTCDPISGTAEAGQYTNEATLTAMVSGTEVTVTDLSHYFGSDPEIRIDKLTNGQDGQTLIIGCPVTWTYDIYNDGNIDLEQIVLDDDQIGIISCPETTLLPGDSMTCESTGTVISGTYENEGRVDALDPIGNGVFDTDTSSYIGSNQCANVIPSDDRLWPPNHRLETISLVGSVCGGNAASFTITGITQDEPLNGLGDGDTSPDGIINGDGTVELRRERAGGGNGRVYEISYLATDSGGAECSGSVFVGVPHDQGGSEPIDDGQIYDSTQP